MVAPASSTAPRFARYRPSDRTIDGRHFWSVPEGGMCLSAFVVVESSERPNAVLLGKPDPRAPWERMATLEEAHLRAIGDRWILPASHLLEFESPVDGAHRILAQQLEAEPLALRGPEVFSEVYPSILDPESGTHWDMHFVFHAAWPADRPARARAWRELAFLDPRTLARANIARGHADILSMAGHPVADAPTT